MSKVCTICGKRPVAGRSLVTRGIAKKKGGIGLKTTGITKRRFVPNIRVVKTNVNGTIKRIKICAKCLKAGKVVKA